MCKTLLSVLKFWPFLITSFSRERRYQALPAYFRSGAGETGNEAKVLYGRREPWCHGIHGLLFKSFSSCLKTAITPSTILCVGIPTYPVLFSMKLKKEKKSEGVNIIILQFSIQKHCGSFSIQKRCGHEDFPSLL